MTRYFSFEQKRISYSDYGTGNIIVLLHGYLETKDIWNEFAARLSESFRVISVDLPGHGGSDLLNETQTMESMADTVYELLLGLGLTKVFLAGHSLGGYITLAFAERHPELLTGYSLFHSHPFADTQAAVESRTRQITMVIEGRKDQFYQDSVRKMYADTNLELFKKELTRSLLIASSVSGEGIVAVLKGMIARHSRQNVMENANLPCLWLLGAKDNFISYSEAAAKVKLPLASKLVILENSGHMGFVEERDLSVRILTGFIRALKSGT